MTAEHRPTNQIESKDIIHQNIPCWYELSWRKTQPAIILRIHNDFTREIREISPNAPIVEGFMQMFKFTNFIGDLTDDFGFDKTLKHRREKNGFLELVAEIPKVERLTNKKCHSCNGSGRDIYRNGDCLFCEGTGKEYALDFHSAEALSASLTILTLLLRLRKEETSVSFPQLLTVETITGNDINAGSLWGEVSIPLRQWLSSLEGNNPIPEMVEAMKTAYTKMFVRGR